MRLNLPVTQQEYDYPADQMLVSMTDTKGNLTHCNSDFVTVSGFTYDELIGEPHNLIRHPDMPPAAFKDLWRTVGRGRPWTGMVKNRRKDGDHYWVMANVTPIMVGGRPQGYMSVRIKPDRQQIQAAESLYARMRQETEAGRTTMDMVGGELRMRGPLSRLKALTRLTLLSQLAVALAVMVGLGLLPLLLGVEGALQLPTQVMAGLVGAGLVMAWFQLRVQKPLETAAQFSNDLAGCNLTGDLPGRYAEPVEGLVRSLRQIRINLRAVVSDVRKEIENFTTAANEIASGGLDLSSRTEAQASALEQTAASMDELSGTVRQTADTANQVLENSMQGRLVAERGGEAIRQVGQTMGGVHASSARVRDIVGTIESISFQTNMLALNAAVEAARAGEHGRGFAVVASEVRALAKRSDEAAKEIRGLIGESTQRIGEASSQMVSASDTVEQTLRSVREVTELIKHITNATREQASGIAQVNQAVTQLDAATQQNAALVEESAAAAAGLSQGAVSMARSVAVFQL
ncbi:MAG: methyl-accepting chemotaxis protein [Betaproteobacteria bacterium]|jgi:aerotaxis receptor